MTKLSVNINKIATLRNARGNDLPNVCKAAKDIESFGSEGITIHPRPDERHITKQDVYDLKKVVTTEFNIEGFPSDDFVKMVLDVKPEQVTLVPDPPEVLTSNAGWDTIKNSDFLKPILKQFRSAGIRTSLFIECNEEMIKQAKKIGADRIELYTEEYARNFSENKETAVQPYIGSTQLAHDLGLEVNAGHDLSLENLRYFALQCKHIMEVSIGHALIGDALYLGLENAVRMYKHELR